MINSDLNLNKSTYGLPNLKKSNVKLDENNFVLLLNFQQIYNPNEVIQPFTSPLLLQKDIERESTINQKYFEIISSSEYKKNPLAYVQEWILQRKKDNEKNEKWQFPEDDVLKRLKKEFNI